MAGSIAIAMAEDSASATNAPSCVYAVGEVHRSNLIFSIEEIGQGARMVGDMNPLHHDEAYARQSRFGGIVGSGAHVTAFMMGKMAEFMTEKAEGYGLDVAFRLRRPVYPDTPLKLTWTVDRTQFKAKLGGHLVWLVARLCDDVGTDLVEGTATCVSITAES